MKWNKIILPMMVPVIAATGFSITSCNKTAAFNHTAMFSKTKSVAKVVYVVSIPKVHHDQWYVTIQSLQGILAQTSAKIFINTDDNDRNSWIEPMQKEFGFKIVSMTDPTKLLKIFSPFFNSKYVLYKDATKKKDYKELSIDKATTIAAAENILMVEENLEAEIKALGFDKQCHADDFTTAELFTKYKDKLNPSMLFNQKPNNFNLRDYAISTKSFTTYMEFLKTDTAEGGEQTCKDILAWAKPNCPILGWNEDEVQFVKDISTYSKVITPSDHCTNLSFLSAYTPKGRYVQKHKAKIKPQKGKHYVAIVMSDGDNIQWLQSNFTGPKYYGNMFRGQFPITWTLSPGPYDVEGVVLNKIYSMQSDNDNFICGPSGYGYINYAQYGKPADFAKLSANYMEGTDMRVINFIDFFGEKDPKVLLEPMKQEQVKGGVWAFGDLYIAGHGGVHWQNDKPIVCMREALWRREDHEIPLAEEYQVLTPAKVAARINKYSTDPTTISGYTAVSAHVWSYGEMNYVRDFVSQLDDHVVLVTAEQLIDMISENVAHVDVDHADEYPIIPKPSK